MQTRVNIAKMTVIFMTAYLNSCNNDNRLVLCLQVRYHQHRLATVIMSIAAYIIIIILTTVRPA